MSGDTNEHDESCMKCYGRHGSGAVCFSCCRDRCKWYCCCLSCNRCKLFSKGVFSRILIMGYIVTCSSFTLSFSVDYYGDYETQNAIEPYIVTATVCAAIGLLTTLVESCITLNCKKYGEWTRFSPIMFILLFGSVPQLCMMEAVKVKLLQGDKIQCPEDPYYHSYQYDSDELFGSGNESFLLALEQLLVVILVIGRWFLPRGKMSREKLSDMLLAFVGMAVDIMEFMEEGLKVKQIRCSLSYAMTILILTVISLLQFTMDQDVFIGLYFMKKRKRKQEQEYQKEYKKTMRKERGGKNGIIEPPRTKPSKLQKILQYKEAQTILVNMLLQELPFFAIRVYMLAVFLDHDTDAQSLIFFAIKNGLVLLLQVYRLWIILRHNSIPKKKLSKMMKNTSLKRDLKEFPLDEEILIKNSDGEELILTLERKLEPRSIPYQELQNMVDEYCNSDGKILMNEDHYLSNETDKLYLSLREKNEGDEKSAFGGVIPKESIEGTDNEAFTVMENGQTMVQTEQPWSSTFMAQPYGSDNHIFHNA